MRLRLGWTSTFCCIVPKKWLNYVSVAGNILPSYLPPPPPPPPYPQHTLDCCLPSSGCGNSIHVTPLLFQLRRISSAAAPIQRAVHEHLPGCRAVRLLGMRCHSCYWLCLTTKESFWKAWRQVCHTCVNMKHFNTIFNPVSLCCWSIHNLYLCPLYIWLSEVSESYSIWQW